MAYSNYYAASGLFHGSMASVMGTQFDILMVGTDSVLLSRVWEAIETEVKRLDKLLSRFDEASEVSRVNREAAHYPVAVSEELWQILQDCKRYHALTDGLFDITLQGFSQVLLSEKDRSVFFFSESLHVDLGGIGKGYALTRIRELLEKNGVEKALVNFGNSSVLAVGSHPLGDYWPVGVDNPFTKEHVVVRLGKHAFPSSSYCEPADGEVRRSQKNGFGRGERPGRGRGPDNGFYGSG